MKTLIVLIIGLLTGSLLMAQGTVEFRADLQPVPYSPPEIKPGAATFHLQGNILTGTAIYFAERRHLFVRIERGDGSIIKDADHFRLVDPIPGADWQWVESTWEPMLLSDNQLNQLFAGDWLVNVTLAPNNMEERAIKGQILLIPEPSIGILFVAGALLLACYRAGSNSF